MTPPASFEGTGDEPRSWRLTFRFDGERLALVKQEHLTKVAPGTAAFRPEAGKHSGSWLFLLGAAGEVLFHRLLHDPFQTRAAHHSHKGAIKLHFREPQPGEFTAVLPDIPGATEVAVYASPFSPEGRHEAAEEVARFRLGGDDRQPTPQKDVL